VQCLHHATPLRRRPAPRAERGVVLFVSLILLLILTLLGVTVARLQTGEERMAQNDKNHQIALQSAEAVLRFVEIELKKGTYTAFAANANGLYQFIAANGSVVDTMNWGVPPPGTVLPYGGPAIAAMPLAAQPVFLIEKMPTVACTNGCQINDQGYNKNTGQSAVYRVTAHGYGGDTTSGSTIQAIFQGF
jgi:type IV pilus assembly protein PilX